MADTDARTQDNRDRRDRGHNSNNNNNRKRRFKEDNDTERQPQRRRYDDRRSRDREPHFIVQLRKQLLLIAESPLRSAEEDIASLSRALANNYEDEKLRVELLDLSLKLVLEQPLKIPFVAAVILHANRHKSQLAADGLTQAGVALQAHIEVGNWRDVKLLLRFLACLHGLFADDGVFPLLETLFDKAIDMQTENSEDTLGIELVKIVLITLPYLLSSTATGLEQRAVDLLEKAEIIANAPHPLESLVDPYSDSGSEVSGSTQSVIALLQKQLQHEAEHGWPLKIIPRLFEPAAAPAVADGEDAEPVKHVFPTINLPDTVVVGPRPIFPEVFFSLYADQDLETVPPTSNIATSLLRDTLTDTINILDFNRNAAAKFLIDVDCYWAPDTFIKRATPFDKLKDVTTGRSTWKPEDLAVDAVFSQIFQLPTPEHKLVYYHSTITEMCRIAPAAIAPSLGRAIRYVFRNLESMDCELSQRFMDWFAHHLSNFEFRWKWTEWIQDLSRSPIHPKLAFIRGVLDKEIRLSFAKRIRETLPPPFHPLIPESKDKDTPDFKYDSDDVPFAEDARRINALLRKKASDEAIQEVISSIHGKAAELDLSDPLVCSTDAYVTAICYVGSKSLSHVLSCIERCKDRLLAIGTDPEASSAAARRQIINSVIDYWNAHPGTAANIIDKLLNYGIVSPMSVIEWVLGDRLDGGKILPEHWAFEMVVGTVGKVADRVRNIVKLRSDSGLQLAEVQELEETLERERADMRTLFQHIEDALVGVAQGSNDQMLEDSQRDPSEDVLIRQWGERWLKVFRRKRAVEETIVGEAAVAPLPLKHGVQIQNGGGADPNGAGTEDGNVEMTA